ncbi:MAG: phosphoribosylformylglycinamidine cyclo-ligase, partial [Anaerolineae bacterium]|nr:phosphoribosylformylglycinamidine cyclo-ligase [Anaerolineae bacterium]
MLDAVKTTYTPAVLAGVGAFGGLYSASELCAAKDPVLVASTDGVGTKTMIAEQMGVYDTVGQDIVNHCLNDTLVQGAHPLFFFDYFASGKIVPEHVAAVVGGCAKACREIGCALLGGETAEMPGVYKPGTFDLVGTMVSWVERDQIIDGSRVRAGDICIGLPSSGLHTNGYSLARRIFADVGWNTVLPELGRPLGEVLLDPHRAYLGEVEALWEAGIDILAMAHITGGGFIENIPRVLPDGIGMTIDTAAWEMPAIFQLIQKMGNVSYNEMYRVLNTGIGLVVIVGASQAAAALRALQGKAHPSGQAVVIGETRAWDGNMPRVQ